MNETAHSEFYQLQKVAIKSVNDSFVSEKLISRQWKNHNFLQKPNFNSSIIEYERFKSIFIENGIEIDYFEFDEEVSIDSIYCRDASIVTDFGVILCSMGKPQRKNEPTSQQRLFKKLKIPTLARIESPGTIEGGDVAWLDEKTLAVGRTYRTNENGIQQLKEILEPKSVQILVAQMPQYRGNQDVFHLMSVFSPIDKDLAVVYSPLLPNSFRNQLLDHGYHFVEVPNDEFESMGCNVLAIAPRKCIMVSGNPKTKAALIDSGCEVILYKGDEISVKGGGGPTCLTRPILRSY